jgi:hypothetical protein
MSEGKKSLQERIKCARNHSASRIHFDNQETSHEPSEELLLSYVPKAPKHIAQFSLTGVLKPGNILGICGHIGLGKSQITESCVSSYLNPYNDNLGIKIQGVERPLLWIDGERTKDDIREGMERIKIRIRYDDNPDLIVGDRFKNVHCHPFITYPNISARVKELERLVLELNPGLLLLDGCADFVRDVNDTYESVDFIALLIALANEHQFGVITSIHPNPGQNQDSKPRGVLGSELLRKAESFLLLKRAPDNRDIRILTMDFSHGKNRNACDNLEHAFTWSKEHKMFVSCEYTPTLKTGKTEEQGEVFNAILSNGGMGYMELVKAVVQKSSKSEPTAKRWIRDAEDRKLIFKDSGLYKLQPF